MQENSLFSKVSKEVPGLILPLQRLKMIILIEEYRKGCEFHYFNTMPNLKIREVIPLAPNIFTSGVLSEDKDILPSHFRQRRN